MHHFEAQVTLISALLLSNSAQSLYDPRHHSSSHLGAPAIEIIKVEQPSVDGIRGRRELLILEGQHPYQGQHLTPHLVSLGNVAAQHYGSAYPHYPHYSAGYAQEHYAPHNYRKPGQPHLVAVENVRPPTSHSPGKHGQPHLVAVENVRPPTSHSPGKHGQPHLVAVENVRPPTSHSPGKHISVYDVNPSAPGPHLYETYLKGLHESLANFPNPIRDEIRPAIDVRSLGPSRAMRRAEEKDPIIVFPQPSDTDDSVEIPAPVREQRDVQIGHPLQDPVVHQLYRYVEQPVATYPLQYPNHESY